MTSDFAPEVAKYPQRSPKPKMAQNVRAYCLAPLAMQLVRFLFLISTRTDKTV